LDCEPPVCDALGGDGPGVTHERGEDAVRAGDGVRAVEDLRAHRRTAPGRRGRAHVGLCRLVPRHGLCATHLARVAARHRGVSGRQSSQAVPHGYEGAAGTLDAGRRPQPARLAHLPCAGAAADRARPSALCARSFGARPRCQRLCAGRYHHRSVPESVCLGAVSIDQGGQSSCTPCWICGARFQRSSTSAMASCTMSTFSTSCRSKPGPST